MCQIFANCGVGRIGEEGKTKLEGRGFYLLGSALLLLRLNANAFSISAALRSQFDEAHKQFCSFHRSGWRALWRRKKQIAPLEKRNVLLCRTYQKIQIFLHLNIKCREAAHKVLYIFRSSRARGVCIREINAQIWSQSQTPDTNRLCVCQRRRGSSLPPHVNMISLALLRRRSLIGGSRRANKGPFAKLTGDWIFFSPRRSSSASSPGPGALLSKHAREEEEIPVNHTYRQLSHNEMMSVCEDKR